MVHGQSPLQRRLCADCRGTCCTRHTLLTFTVAGHVPAIMGAKGPWSFIKWHQTYGKIYKLLFLDEHVVVLSDPATITSITRKAGK